MSFRHADDDFEPIAIRQLHDAASGSDPFTELAMFPHHDATERGANSRSRDRGLESPDQRSRLIGATLPGLDFG